MINDVFFYFRQMGVYVTALSKNTFDIDLEHT